MEALFTEVGYRKSSLNVNHRFCNFKQKDIEQNRFYPRVKFPHRINIIMKQRRLLFKDPLYKVSHFKTQHARPLNNFPPKVLSLQQLSLKAWPGASNCQMTIFTHDIRQLLLKSQRTFPTKSLGQEQQVPHTAATAPRLGAAHCYLSLLLRLSGHITDLMRP